MMLDRISNYDLEKVLFFESRFSFPLLDSLLVAAFPIRRMIADKCSHKSSICSLICLSRNVMLSLWRCHTSSWGELFFKDKTQTIYKN